MTLQTAFFAFKTARSEAKEVNQAITMIRERFADTKHRIINVETVQPETFFGFQLKGGGLRIWYESSDAATDPASLVQPLFDQINT